MKSWQRAVPLLLLLAGLFFYVLRATAWFSAVPGDMGDARFNSVILEHLFQWVTGDAASLWSPAFFYPAQGTLAFSDNHFGSGAVYILLRFAGLSREHAFDGWFAVGCMLNFIAMYVVMRKLDFSPAASGVAAFIYAFCLPAMAQGGHAQLIYRFAIPLAYLSFLQFVRERRSVRLAQLAAWGTLQFYCSIYLGVFLGYLLAATAVAMLIPALRPVAADRLPPDTGRISAWSYAAVLLCAGLTAFLLLKYHSIGKGYGFSRSAAEVIPMLPRPQSYLSMYGVPVYRWVDNGTPPPPFAYERQMFMGVVPLLLAFWALVTSRTEATAPTRRLLGLMAAALALLITFTLYVGGASLYQLAMALPGVKSIRAVSRIILVMALPVAIMAAIGVENLLKRPGTRWLFSGLLVAALSIETLAYPVGGATIDQWRSRLAPMEKATEGMALRPDSVLYLSGRSDEPFHLTELDGMVFAQDRKIATLNGYSGNAPPGYREPHPCVSAAMRIQGMAGTVLARQRLSPEALLARTLWLPVEECATPRSSPN